MTNKSIKHEKFQGISEEQGEKLTANLREVISPPVKVFLEEDYKRLYIIYYKDYKVDATDKNMEEFIDRQNEAGIQILAVGEIMEEKEMEEVFLVKMEI